MNLPWLQVEQSTFERAAIVANMLGISKNEAIGAVLNLWRSAISLADPRTPSPGLFVPNDAEEFLAELTGIGNADVTRYTIVDAFVFAGFVEINDSGLRVRGVSRYLETELKKEKKASDSAERVRKHRESLKNARDGGNADVTRYVTQKNAPREEKRREENIYKTARTQSTPKAGAQRAVAQKEKAPKPPPHPNWNSVIDWLEAISVWAGCARPNWKDRNERAALKSILAHVERNKFRLGLVGELWCLAQTNTEKFTPQALTLRAFEANFEKLRCWTGYQAALERQRLLGMPQEPNLAGDSKQPTPHDSGPPPSPDPQDNKEDAPEGQPEAFKAILRAVQ